MSDMYSDLFLLHSPYGGKTARLSSWKAVVDAVAAGEIRIGGVSNFGVRHLQELEASATNQPAVNQIEVHPFNTQQNITDFCTNKGIVVEAYAPLGKSGCATKGWQVYESLTIPSSSSEDATSCHC